MSNDAKIEPALSAEEWKQMIDTLNGSDQWCLLLDDDIEVQLKICHDWSASAIEMDDVETEPDIHLPGVSLDGPSTPVEISRPADLCQLIALCNAALPDGHPLKLTRDDVQLLRHASSGFIVHATAHEMALRALAAKIEALLPPE